MSNIEDRIVRMKWDAADFNKAAQNTLQLLQDFGKSVEDIKGNLSKSFDGLDFKAINEAAENVNKQFTLMGRVAFDALDGIAKKALEVGKNVADALVFKPISSGFDEYGLLMDSTQVIIANTGRSLEDVDNALEELNHYADKTIYNFSHMTSAIGRFSAAGVGLEDSVAAIQGLSNLSALVGASAEHNSMAMESVSKALASGRMAMMQWYTFERAGSLGGKVTREAIIEAAKELGVFEQQWSMNNGKTIEGAELLEKASTDFRNTLGYNWVTSEVLLRALAKFSDETTELGQRAMKAATEVRTFAKLWDALQEAVQSSWSQTFKYIFGDYEEGTTFWTAINDEVSEFIGMISDSRNGMLEYWHDNGGRDSLINGIVNFYKKIKGNVGTTIISFLEGLRDDTGFDWFFRDVTQKGAILVSLSNTFRTWTENFTISNQRLLDIRNALNFIVKRPIKEIQAFVKSGGFASMLKNAQNRIAIILNLFGTLEHSIKKVFGAGETLGIGTWFAKVQNVTAGVTSNIEKLTGAILYSQAEWEKFSTSGSDAYYKLQPIFERLLQPLQYISTLFNNIAEDDLVAIFTDLFEIALSLTDALSHALKMFTTTLDEEWLANVVNKVRTFLDDVNAFFQEPQVKDNFTRIFTGILSVGALIADVISQIARAILPDMEQGFFGTARTLTDILAMVGDWLTHVEDIVQKYDLIYNAISVIKAFLSPFLEFVKDVFGSIWDRISEIFGLDFQIMGPAVLEDLGEARSGFEAMAMSFTQNLETIKQKATDLANTIIYPFQVLKRLLFGLFDTINKDQWIQKLVTPYKDLLNILTTADWSPLLNLAMSLANIIGTLGSNLTQAVQDIFAFSSDSNVLTNLLDIIGKIADKINEIVNSEWGQTALKRGIGSIVSLIRIVWDVLIQIVDFINNSGILDRIFAWWDVIIKDVANFVTYIGDTIRWLERVIRHNNLIKGSLEAIYAVMEPIVVKITEAYDWVMKLTEKIFNTNFDLGSAYSKIFGSPRKVMEEWGASVQEAIDSTKEQAKGFAKILGVEIAGTEPYIKENIEVVKEGAEETLSFTDRVAGAFSTLMATYDKIKAWISEKWTKLLTESGLGEAFKTFDVSAILPAIGSAIKMVAGYIWSKITGLWTKDLEEEAEKDENKPSFFARILDGLIGNLDEEGKEKEPLSLKLIGDSINAYIEKIKTGIKEKIKAIPNALKEAILGNNEEGEEAKKGLVGAIKEKIDWIINSLKPLGAAISPKLEFLKTFFGPTIKSIGEVINEIMGSLHDFLADKNGNITLDMLIERASEIVNIFVSTKVGELMGSISSAIEGVTKVIKKVSKKIPKLADSMNDLIKSVDQAVKDLSKSATGILDSIKTSIATFGTGFNTFLNTTIKGFLDKTAETFNLFLTKTLPKMFKKIAKGINAVLKGFGSMMKDIGKGVKRYLTGKAINEAAEGMLKFAIAVGILAVAIWALGKVDDKQLKKGALVVGGIMAALFVFAAILIAMMKKNQSPSEGLGGALTAVDGLTTVMEYFKESIGGLIEEISGALSKLAQVGIVAAFIIAIKVVVDSIVKLGKLKPEQALVGVIGVIGVLIGVTVAMKSLLKSADGGTFKIRQVLGMLAMILVIKTAVGAVVKIGGLSWEEMARGVMGVVAVLIALAFVFPLMFGAFKTDKKETGMSLRQVLGMLALCVAINTVANAVVKLSKVPVAMLVLATIVIGSLTYVFAEAMKLIGENTKDFKFTAVLGMVALAAAVWVLGNAVKSIAKLDAGDSIRAAAIVIGLMAAFAGIEYAASQMTGKGIASILIIAALMAAIALGLAYMAEKFSMSQTNKYRKIAEGLTKVMLSLSITLAVCGAVGKLAGGEVATGIVSLGVLILVLAATFTAIGSLVNWIDKKYGGAGSKALDTAIVVMTKLGEAIGNFFGEIVGSFALRMGKRFEEVGKSLSAFITNAKTFFDLAGNKGKTKAIIDGVGGISKAILSLTANDILDTLNIFKDRSKNPYERFAEMLKTFAPAFKEFADNVKESDAKKTSQAIKAISDLIEAASNIPNQGGIVADIFGDNTLTKFAMGIASFTPKFKRFLDSMTDIDYSHGGKRKVDDAIDFATKVAEMADKIPNQGGAIANIFGDNTLSQFAKGIADFTPTFNTFLTTFKDIDYGKDGKQKVDDAIDFAVRIAEFAKSLSGFSGVTIDLSGILPGLKITAGTNPLTEFAKGLVPFTEALSGFIVGMEGSVGAINTNNVWVALDMVGSLVTFVRELPPMSSIDVEAKLGTKNPFFKASATSNRLVLFAQGLEELAPAMTKFIKHMNREVKYANMERVTQALGVVDSLVTFVRKLPEMETFDLEIGGDNPFIKYRGTNNPLVQFAEGLGEFVTPFSTFLETVGNAGYNPLKVWAGIQFAEAAAQIAEKSPRFGGIKEVWTGIQNLAEFGHQLELFAPGFKTYLETVGGASYDETVVAKSQHLMDSLAGMAGTIKGQESALRAFFFGDDSLEGIGNGLGILSDAMTSYSTALDTMNWSNTDRAAEFIKSLGDLAIDFQNADALQYLPIDQIVGNIENLSNTLAPKLSEEIKAIVTDKLFEKDATTNSEIVGGYITTGIFNGFNASIETVKRDIKNGIIEALDFISEKVNSTITTSCAYAAINFIKAVQEDLASTVPYASTLIYNAMDSIGAEGTRAINDQHDPFFNAAAYAVDGFIAGIQDRKQLAIDELAALAQASADVVAAGLQEHSPSKVFERIGRYIPEGFMIGIKSKSPEAVHTLETALVAPIDAITGVLNGDIEYNPRIRPIVDLGGARSSVNTLNSMFGSRTIGLTDSTIRIANDNAAIRTRANKGYSDKNVLRSLDGLRADMNALNGAIGSMGLYLDGDKLVGGITNRVDKQLGTNQARKRRFV